MVNEPKPPVHDRLTAYAAARRRQMGPPLALPPETRRLLLDAVERHFAAASGQARLRWTAWLRASPRWGWATAVFLALAGSGAVWLGWGPRSAAPLALAKKTDGQSLPAAWSSPTMTATQTPSPPAVAPVAPTPSGPAPVGQTVSHSAPAPGSGEASRSAPESALRLESPPAAEPVATAAGRQRPSAPSVAIASRKQEATVPEQPRRFAPNLPVGSATNRHASAGQAQTIRTVRQSFRQVTQAPSNAGRVSLTNRVPLLDRFQLEAGGDRLRIVDADGSVYEGNRLASGPGLLIAEASGTAVSGGRAGTDSVGVALRGGENPRYGLAVGGASPRAPPASEEVLVEARAREWAFVAAGTNRSLGQLVRVEGRLVLTNQFPVSLTAAEGGANRGDETIEFFLQNSILRGQAVLGDQRAISIQATPVGP